MAPNPITSPTERLSEDEEEEDDEQQDDGSLHIGFPDIEIPGGGNGNDVDVESDTTNSGFFDFDLPGGDEQDDEPEEDESDGYEFVGPYEAWTGSTLEDDLPGGGETDNPGEYDQGWIAPFTGETWEYTGLNLDLPDVGDLQDSYRSGPAFGSGDPEDWKWEDTSSEFREQEGVQETIERMEELKGEDTLGYYSERGALATEYAFDNPGMSVQNRTKDILQAVMPNADSEEEVAENIQSTALNLRDIPRTTLAEAGEGTFLDPDAGYEVEVPGIGADFNTGEFSDAIASFGGALTDYIILEPVASGVQTFTGIDPVGGYEPGMLDAPEEGEVTGESDTINRQWWEPLFDIAGLGVGAVLGSGARGVGKATSKSDEVGRLISEGTQEGSQGTMAIYDDLFRFMDEMPGAVDEAASPVGRTVGDAADEGFDVTRVDLSPGAADDATRVTDTAIDEAVENPVLGPSNWQDDVFGPSLDELGDVVRGGDEAADIGWLDEGGSALDDTVTAGDEPGAGFFEEYIGNPISRAVDDFTGAADEGASVSDEFGSATDDAASRFGGDYVNDEFADATRFSDEFGSSFDETVEGAARTSDDLTRPFDELSGTADEAGGLFERLRPSKLWAGVAGAGVLGAGYMALNMDNAPQSTENGAWAMEQAQVFTAENGRRGIAYRIYQAGEQQGFAVVVSFEPFKTLTQGGSARNANASLSALQNGREGAHLIPEFATIQQARQTFMAWASEEGDDATDSEMWSGSVSAPSSVGRGEGFNVDATVENTTNQQQTTRFELHVTNQRGTGRLAQKTVDVSASSSEDFTFNVQRTTSRMDPGEYTLILAAPDGRIDSTSVTVGEGDGESGEWGPWEMVGTLGNGWYVAAQQHSQEDRTRFVGVGKRSDGTRIYLQPSGRATTSPHYFDSEEAVRQAYQQWRQRASSGEAGESETPDPNAGRPTSSGIDRDTRGRTAGSIGGLVDLATSPVGIGAIIVIAIAIYYLSDGQPIQWVQEQYNDLLGR